MAYPRGARGFRGGGGRGRIAQRQNWGDYSHLLGPPVENSWHYHSNRHTDFFGYNPLFAEDAASATPPGGGNLFVEQHQAVQSSVPQQDYGQFYQYNKTAARSPLEEKDFKSLPDEIRNIILNASYRGSLNAQDGFKLRAFYDGLMDSLKRSFYSHLLFYLGQEDADLIANKAEQSRGQAEGNDDDGGVDVEFDFAADSSSSQVPIVASISHKRNRFVKAKGGAGGLKTPMRKENPLDYTKDEIPGVTSDAQGGLTFSKATVRWIRSVLYVLHRSGKGDDVAPAFLAQMSEFFGEECVKQVKDYAHMWRLNQAAQKAAEDTTKVAPEEKARLEQVANLKKIMHHLTFEEVVGLTGQEELRGLSQTTITWIREIVLSILRVKMNPDPFVKRIGDMFGMMAMDRAWAK
uniref:Uncharacterized protein n=1 Tax=Plectus sambesii TaxID=2011161 RepID=A0A914WEX2_9BILA